MHDRKKVPKEVLDAAQRQQVQNKIGAYRDLVAHCAALRQAGDHSPQALAQLDKLQLINPDLYTFWNYRKEILAAMLVGLGDAKRQEVVLAELALNAKVITERDPKSYCTWYHRKWVVRQHPTVEVLTNELRLCAKGLNVDERNFHCWGYRRWVTGLLQDAGQWSAARELEYNQQRIEQNFSNYSAWHNRALVLKCGADEKALAEEVELVSQALYTDAKDQSAWIYSHWLMTQSADALPGVAEVCRDLLADAPAAKWPLVTLAIAAEAQGDRPVAAQCWAALCEADPQHQHYYEERGVGLAG